MRALSPFAVALVAGAFLLFLVQPMLARVLLPWFGGSPSVWTICLLFFQSMLCAGYAYAHLLNTRLTPARQALVHGTLLVASLLLLPPLPSAAWRPDSSGAPEARILILLLVVVGLPYFLLSSTAPLMQAWYARVHAGRVARTASTAGRTRHRSLALLVYPTLIEPELTVRHQGWLWAALYLCFAAAVIVAARQSARGPAPAARPEAGKSRAAVPRPRRADTLLRARAGSCCPRSRRACCSRSPTRSRSRSRRCRSCGCCRCRST